MNRHSKQHIHGVNAVAAMPFTAQNEIDYLSFDRLINHLKHTGIQGITLFGIASEFYKLNDYEKEALAHRFIGNLSDSTVFGAFSVTDHATTLAVKRAKHYQCIGANALMLLPPFFLKPNLEQIKTHLFSVLDAVSIPVLIQYAPAETHLEITPENMAEIASQYPHAVFKIECNPPVAYTQTFLQYAPDAVVMNGYAGLYMLDMLQAGGKGVMPGCSFAEIYVAIYAHWQKGELDLARALHQKLLPYIKKWMVDCEYIIQVEKTILKYRHIIEHDQCRAPAYPLPVDEQIYIQQFLKDFNSYLNH